MKIKFSNRAAKFLDKLNEKDKTVKTGETSA